MRTDQIIASFELPASCRVDQRVAKKLFLENGAPTTADKKAIQAGIEEVRWIATLKPATIGIAAFKDETRDYSEIALLTVRFRPEAKVPRLSELIHRAIPYPLVLLTGEPAVLSLSHKRLSLGEAGKVVLEGDLHRSAPLAHGLAGLDAFLTELPISRQGAPHCFALYQSWIDRLTALRAASVTGFYPLDLPNSQASVVNDALNERDLILREIANLRARAAKEKQLSRRVELNLDIQSLTARLAALMTN
jgi:Domain of unknown function (DUF4391)